MLGNHPIIQKKINPILRGFSQIMLQENAFTGLLFLIGIMVNSITLGIAAFVAGMSGTYFAKKKNYNPIEIDRGLYGFSAALVGIAVMISVESLLVSWFMVVFGGAFAAIIQRFFIIRGIPVFTLPFVIVTWLFVESFSAWMPDLVAQPIPLEANISKDLSIFAYGQAVLRGFGQVNFQNLEISGTFFLLGILVNSPVTALYASLTAFFSAVVANFLGFSSAEIVNGLWGYNTILCAAAFAGPKLTDALWVFICVTLGFLTYWAMSFVSFPALTFPFVVAAFTTFYIKEKFNKTSFEQYESHLI